MRYKILKTFPGSQDGRFTENFTEGEEVELSDYLAGIVVPDGWAKPLNDVAVDDKTIVTDNIQVDNKAIVTDGKPKRRGRPKNKEVNLNG